MVISIRNFSISDERIFFYVIQHSFIIFSFINYSKKWSSKVENLLCTMILFQNLSKAVKNVADHFSTIRWKVVYCLSQFLSTVFIVTIIGHFLAHVREHWIYCLSFEKRGFINFWTIVFRINFWIFKNE